MNGYKPALIDFSNPMKLDKWAIPQTKIINAPIKIDKIIFIKFLLKRFFEKYAITNEAKIIP